MRRILGSLVAAYLKINEALPDRSPMLGDADFPGALTVLRHGFGTPDETAAWLINGDFYRDHYHCDFGAVMLYALGSPISVHWGSLYQPRMAGAWMQNVVVPEAALDAPWNSADVSTDECFGNRSQIISEAGLKVDSITARAAVRFDNKGGFWNRRVWDYRSDPAAPVLRIRDEFSGTGATDPKIFSLTLMATGPVETAEGSREVPVSSAPAKPPAGAPFALASGVTRLGFKGQWGVDFDVFIVAERCAAGDNHRVEAFLAPDPRGRRVPASDRHKVRRGAVYPAPARHRPVRRADCALSSRQASARPGDYADI